MLGDYEAMPTLATCDLKRARSFYEGTLGLTPFEIENEGVIYQAGPSHFLVYPSAFGATNKATYMSFQVPGDRFDAEVAELKARGIVLDEFEFADAVWEHGVMAYGETRGVWFRDPDGNIISVETHPRVKPSP